MFRAHVGKGCRVSDSKQLDRSLRREIAYGGHARIEVAASVTSSDDRENIFYVDRVSNERVNQLPMLPSLGATFYW